MLAAPAHNRTSSDYGETFVPHKNPGDFMGLHTVVRPHPQHPDWLLAHARRPGCTLFEAVEMHCPADLFVTQVRAFSEML